MTQATPEPSPDPYDRIEENVGNQSLKREKVPGPRWQRYYNHHKNQYLSLSKILVYIRLAVSSIFLLALMLTAGSFPSLTVPVAVVIGLYLIVTLTFMGTLGSSRDPERAVLVQIALEVICETLLIYIVGGVFHVIFAIFYFLSIITAALLLSKRAAFVCASFCSVALAIIACIYYMAFLGYYELPFVTTDMVEVVQLRWDTVVLYLIQLPIALHLVAYLSAYLPFHVSSSDILYEEILSQIREGVVAIDNSGRIVYVNQEALRLFNWDGIPQLLGKRFPEVLRREEDHIILEVLTAGNNIHGEIALPIRDGAMLPVEVKITALRDNRQMIRGVVGLFSDLTLKQKVNQVETRLQKLRGLEEMAIGIAHEIRNPLASIRGAMQELGRRAFNDEDDRILASIVLKESDRLDSILDSFMNYARLKPIALKSTDAIPLIEEIVVLLRCREDAKNIDISVDSHLPAVHINLDSDQIKQVLINLGVNSLQALEENGQLSFRVREGELHRRDPGDGNRVYEGTRALEILVEDNGPGIEASIQNKLFTPFFSTKSQGTGLGLALAQKIIDAHGGDISYEKMESVGSRFRIRLPLIKDQAE